jgi:hypothetical protein
VRVGIGVGHGRILWPRRVFANLLLAGRRGWPIPLCAASGGVVDGWVSSR